MITVKFTVDGSNCNTIDYQNNPGKYRGRIVCLECNQKAWFIKSFKTPKINRMACFAAHHEKNCTASTVLLVSDDEDSDQEKDENINSSEICIDLDKATSQSIFISDDNNKHGEKDSNWKSSPNINAIGNSSGYPLNKTLRQLLTNLCRNRDFAEKEQTIKVVADSGRTIIEGILKEYLVHLSEITKSHTGDIKIFWGTINNLNEKDDSLWLNYGDYHTEPSVLLNNSMKEQLIKNFKLSDVSDLDGSDLIIVGRAGFSPNGKAVIKTGFTKYMSFRRHRILNK